MKSLRTTLMCIGMAGAAMAPATVLAQDVPSTTNAGPSAPPVVGGHGVVGAGAGGTVGVVADPNNAYMQPTGPTPLAAKLPPNSAPGNLTPGAPPSLHAP